MTGFKKGSFRKYLANTSWLAGEKFLRAAMNLLVGVFIARYLGPEKFGILSYALSVMAILFAICSLGLDDIIVRDVVEKKAPVEKILGTAFSLRLIFAVLILMILNVFWPMVSHDALANILVSVITLGLLFKVFNVIEFYFLSQVLSKYAVFAHFTQLLVSSVLLVIFVLLKKSLFWFSLGFLLDTAAFALVLWIFFARHGQRISRWTYSSAFAGALLKDAWPLILSTFSLIIFMKIDQVMIKNMLGNAPVGIYAVAVRISEVWIFLPVIISGSVFPALLNARRVSIELYHHRLQALNSFFVLVCLLLTGFIFCLAPFLVTFFFGAEFSPAASTLRIHIFSSFFVFLNWANTKYLLAENLTKIPLVKSLAGMVSNILLNLYLIPRYGINGAAWATVISSFLCLFVLFLIPRTKHCFLSILKSFLLVGLWGQRNR